MHLCDGAEFTGYTRDGGYADHVVADARYAFPLPDAYSDAEAAPLLCAGLIGHRSLRMAGDAEHLGIYGFKAAAHIVAQVGKHKGRRVYAFTRPGDRAAQDFALHLEADWAGGSDEAPPHVLDALILFAPVGGLIPAALGATAKGGTVVCGGIHMSDVPSFPYSRLWGERVVRSVANLTRQDARIFSRWRQKFQSAPRRRYFRLLRRMRRCGEFVRASLRGCCAFNRLRTASLP